MKIRTLARRFAPLSTVLILDLLAMPRAHAAPASVQPRPAYRFDLVQGQRVAVCEAYLARLNMTDYQDPPYCDRPEHAAIPGFTRLQRVPLSAEAVQALLPRVTGFTRTTNQDLYDIENARRQRDGLPFTQPLSDVRNSLGWELSVAIRPSR